MREKSIYITVRLDLRAVEDITEELIQEVISELGYSFESNISTVKIECTEICGINE